ncbi:MAG: DegT/DnrJ/EryC1/StrS family aminotransferase [Chloroflexi bacterium]|nr:DegT/DnrJ/EryC1/StrS family aminotransferase [Chloroflexota bacterium]
MDWLVPLADLDYGAEEETAVRDVLHSRWLTMGGVTQEFENEFAQFTGARHAIAVSNATVALHLAMLALGIGPGDEVIAPSLTFVATTNAVLYAGADVRFADIVGPCDLTIAPAEIEKQITPRTRAIVVMHYGGYAGRMDAILDIAARHKLAVIEDAAHAPGAKFDGRALGTLGDVGCFSFFSNKNLSTGEGGMLVTGRDDLAAKVRLLRSHGMTTLTWDRHQGHAHSYDVTALGYNYRIDELRSALGRAQLAKLEKGNARRREITARYWDALEGIGLELPFRGAFRGAGGSPAASACHLFPVLLPPDADRAAFMDGLRAAGIQTSIHYPPIHCFSYYRERYPGVALPLTEAVAAREVTLPLYPTMSDAQVEMVIAAVRAGGPVVRNHRLNEVETR